MQALRVFSQAEIFEDESSLVHKKFKKEKEKKGKRQGKKPGQFRPNGIKFTLAIYEEAGPFKLFSVRSYSCRAQVTKKVFH